MDDRAALIAAIRANPDDDMRHLVYADWLEETGNPAHVARARLIRLQCESRRRAAEGREGGTVDADARKLLERFAWAWGPSQGNTLVCREIDRGLTRYHIAGSTTPGFIERATDYHYALPPEACLHIEVRASTKTDLAQFGQAPFAERIVGLTLDFRVHSFMSNRFIQTARKTVGQLAAGPWAGPLSELEFNGMGETPAHIRTLAASPQLRTLAGLKFYYPSGDGDAIVHALADAPPWPRMRSLFVGGPDISDEARDRLVPRYPAGVVEV